VKNTIQFKKQLKLQTLFFADTSTCNFIRAIRSPREAPRASEHIPRAGSHHLAQDSWEESAGASGHFHTGLEHGSSTLQNIFKKNLKSSLVLLGSLFDGNFSPFQVS